MDTLRDSNEEIEFINKLNNLQDDGTIGKKCEKGQEERDFENSDVEDGPPTKIQKTVKK